MTWEVDRVRMMDVNSDTLTGTISGTNPGGSRALTLCMIARDEEANLHRCLESVRGVVDEIVVADTGSVDRTRDVARQHGARVLDVPWQDDFSAARNAALAEVRTPWVLVLDADEVLDSHAGARIREAIQVQDVYGYYLEFENPTKEGERLHFHLLRLFRLAPGVRFQYVIHEQVAQSLTDIFAPQGGKLRVLDALVQHVGYREETMKSKGKEERNIRLFEKQIQEYGDDIFSWYKFGDFLRSTSQRHRALAMIEKAAELLFAMPPEEAARLPYAGEILTLLAMEWHDRGRDEEAYGLLKDAEGAFVWTSNQEYIKAGLALNTRRFDQARVSYLRCRENRTDALFTAQRAGVSTFLSSTGLASVAVGQGDLREAEGFFRQALRENATHRPAVLGLATLLALQKRAAEGCALVRDYLGGHPDDLDLWIQYASFSLRAGSLDEARTAVEAANSLSGPDVRIARLRGAAALVSARTDEAIRAFSLFGDDLECSVGRFAAQCAHAGSTPTPIRGSASRIAPILKAYAELLAANGRDEVIRRLEQEIPRLETTVPGITTLLIGRDPVRA